MEYSSPLRGDHAIFNALSCVQISVRKILSECIYCREKFSMKICWPDHIGLQSCLSDELESRMFRDRAVSITD